MKTNFDPLTHGYKFQNRFEFKGIKKLTSIFKNKLIYGMCGGMVFTALDYFFDQKKVPKFHHPSELTINYAKYLWRRQTESVSLSALIKLIYYALLPQRISIRKSIENELPKALDLLLDNLPVPLIIIRSNFFQNPTHNHQVLVTQMNYKNNVMEMVLYDPNHPQISPSIIVDKDKKELFQTTGELVRGFFVNKYQYRNSEQEY